IKEKLQTELIQITVLRIKSFSEFTLNDLTELYTIILIDRESSVTIVTERREREKNLLTADISTADIITADTEDVIEEVKLLRLTDITEFNLIFLTIIEATVTS
ncbi:hypothetical protein EMPG_12934, partial [Blastomyces silverae]